MSDDDPAPPEGIDQADIDACRSLIRNAVNQRNASIGEAAAEARGFLHARYRRLFSNDLQAAIDWILITMQLLPPAPMTVERGSTTFVEMDEVRLARDITFLLRFSATGKPHSGRNLTAGTDLTSAAATLLIQGFQARGYIVLAPKRAWKGSTLGSLP